MSAFTFFSVTQVMKISLQTGFISEYTRMVLSLTDKQKYTMESAGMQKVNFIPKLDFLLQ